MWWRIANSLNPALSASGRCENVPTVPTQDGTLELSVTVGNWSFSASGETSVVLDAYADSKEFVGATPTVAPPEASRSEQAATAPAASTRTEVKSPTTLPLKPYLARLNLRGNQEKATAILAWSAESGNKKELTAAEVETLWKKTQFRAPANLPRDLRAAEAEGWLDSKGKSGSPDATFSINGYGEGIIAGWVVPSKE